MELPSVQHWVGHKSISSTLIYAKNNPKKIEKNTKMVEDSLIGKGKKR